MELNKSKVKEWVAALRSGKYEQGMGALKNPEGKMCCLGVLCDLNSVEVQVNITDDCVGDNNFLIYENIRSKLGEPFVDKVIRMNDTGKSFNEIADKIEEIWV